MKTGCSHVAKKCRLRWTCTGFLFIRVETNGGGVCTSGQDKHKLTTLNGGGGGGGRGKGGKISPPPKPGLKIGSGQHTNPALSCTGSFLTFRASSLNQHMARRLRNHLMSYIRRFLWRKNRGVLQGILGRGVPPDSPNSDPISDQNMALFKPVFRPGL